MFVFFFPMGLAFALFAIVVMAFYFDANYKTGNGCCLCLLLPVVILIVCLFCIFVRDLLVRFI